MVSVNQMSPLCSQPDPEGWDRNLLSSLIGVSSLLDALIDLEPVLDPLLLLQLLGHPWKPGGTHQQSSIPSHSSELSPEDVLDLLRQPAISGRADFRKEGITFKLLQDLCDKQSGGSRPLHQLLGSPKPQITHFQEEWEVLEWWVPPRSTVPPK